LLKGLAKVPRHGELLQALYKELFSKDLGWGKKENAEFEKIKHILITPCHSL